MSIHTTTSFRGGISDEYQRGIAGSFKFGKNISIRKFNDTLTCTQAMKKESASIVVDLIVAMVNCSNGKIFGFGDTGKIYSRTAGGTWALETTDADGAISGACEWGNVTSGQFIYWTVSNGTTWKVKRTPVATYNFASPTTVASTAETVAGTAYPHTMRTVAGSCLITNGTGLAVIDYTSLTFTNNVYIYPPDNILTSIEEFQGSIATGAKKKDNTNEGWIYTWNAEELFYSRRLRIPSKGVTAMVQAEDLYAFVGNAIHYSDFTNVMPLYNFDIGTCEVYAVGTSKGKALFGIGSTNPDQTVSGIYAFGRERFGMPRVLTLEHTLSPGGVERIGAITTYGDLILASWKNGSTYGVDVLDTANKATGVYESLEFHMPPTYMSPKFFKALKIKMTALPTGCSIAVAIKKNKASSWSSLKTVTGETTYSVVGGTEAIFSIGETMNIYELQITSNPSVNTCPEIIDIETYID